MSDKDTNSAANLLRQSAPVDVDDESFAATYFRPIASGRISIPASPPADVAGMREALIASNELMTSCLHPGGVEQYAEALHGQIYTNRRLLKAIPEPKADAAVKALVDLTRDCMASDFNEHWESYKNAEAVLAGLRQPVAGDASDLVKALKGEQKAIDTILEKGRWLMSEPYLSGARVTIGTDNMKDAGDIQKAFAELKKSALTRHRQGEKA